VLHECDRFTRNLSDPTSVYTTRNLKGEASSVAPDSALAFATIQGWALHLMGTLIRADEGIAADGEPDEPREYFEVALNTFKMALEHRDGNKETSPDQWNARMEIVWGDAINALIELGDEVVQDSVQKHAPADAVAHYFSALNYLPLSMAGKQSSQSELDVDFTLSRETAILEGGRGVIEAMTFEDDVDVARSWCNRVLKLLDGDSLAATDEGESGRLADIELLRGACWATAGSLLSERCAGADDYPESLKTSEADTARKELRKAIKSLLAAKQHINNHPDSDPYNEAVELLGNAYLHLGNVTEDEAERESLYGLAKEAGIDIDAASEEGSEG